MRRDSVKRLNKRMVASLTMARVAIAIGALVTAGCTGSGGQGGTGGATTGTGGSATASGGASGTATGGTQGSGGSGSGGNGAGSGGAVGSGGSGSGGQTATGGSSGSGGSGTGGGASGGSTGSGGGAGMTGSGGGGGAGAGTGSGGANGSGGATTKLGSSGKAVCPTGTTFGDPLAGMGSVVTISAPTTPPANYFAFIEGPVWIASLGTLFFSDNASSPDERIFKLVPPATTPELFKEPSGSNGLAVDNTDNLVLADQKNHAIVRMDAKTGAALGTIVPAGSFKPNDVLVRSDDNVYFSDPAMGFYRVSPSGTLSGPFKTVSQPNGIALSPDEKTLYVGDVGNRQIYAFPVATDGTVDTASGKLFVTAMNQTVDGMCVDCAGNLYASTQSGVEVYKPDASYIGTVPTGEASNCTFGGADRKTLYVTSRSVLKAVTLGVPGLPD